MTTHTPNRLRPRARSYAHRWRFSTTSRLAHSPTRLLSAPAMARQINRRRERASHSSDLDGSVMQTRQRASTLPPHSSIVGEGGGSKRCWDRWSIAEGVSEEGWNGVESCPDVGTATSASSGSSQCRLRSRRPGMWDTGGPGRSASLSRTGTAAMKTLWVHAVDWRARVNRCLSNPSCMHIPVWCKIAFMQRPTAARHAPFVAASTLGALATAKIFPMMRTHATASSPRMVCSCASSQASKACLRSSDVVARPLHVTFAST